MMRIATCIDVAVEHFVEELLQLFETLVSLPAIHQETFTVFTKRQGIYFSIQNHAFMWYNFDKEAGILHFFISRMFIESISKIC